MAIIRREDRKALETRREPYWSRVREGCYVGYRKLQHGEGTWVARYRDREGKQQYKALGTFVDGKQKAYDQAVKTAGEWFANLDAGVTPKTITVRAACEQYVRHLRSEDGDAKADTEDKRLQRLVYDDALGRIELTELRPEHVNAWRERLRARPALVTRHKDKNAETVTRARSPATVNRDMVPLRAALNYAFDLGQVATPNAWRVALKPIGSADSRRELYLDRAERKRLVEKADDEIRPFLKALALLPLRPGALAALTAGDFDPRLRTLRIASDKTRSKKGARTITVPPETATFLKAQKKGKLPAAPLFRRADGSAWNKDAWKLNIKAAVEAAGLPAAATAYTMRHSTITDLVTSGLDLLTVAQISGTSVAMIERHYGHHRKDHAAAALAKLSLQ